MNKLDRTFRLVVIGAIIFSVALIGLTITASVGSSKYHKTMRSECDPFRVISYKEKKMWFWGREGTLEVICATKDGVRLAVIKVR